MPIVTPKVERCVSCLNIREVATWISSNGNRRPICRKCAEIKGIETASPKKVEKEPDDFLPAKVLEAIAAHPKSKIRVLATLTYATKPVTTKFLHTITRLELPSHQQAINALYADGLIARAAWGCYRITPAGLRMAWTKAPEICNSATRPDDFPAPKPEPTHLERFQVRISSQPGDYAPLPPRLLSALSKAWAERTSDKQPLHKIFTKVAKVAGIEGSKDWWEGDGWNRLIDWLDVHHPTWRGESVAIADRTIAQIRR